ncbi:hypothetical protein EDEG_02983 [Edhazardia aedis USNM 41457]|uniref:histidine--tRNA ligase n=1 Tax=Edhazardia aedis (strain USNM 41457) TaxID=1003232 RepID=J9DJ52_EDHAE|nr:hypothetical protein EDEG_02983 [Edhazardia aedis USNM 41457]|eukprot:EJW02625.1 hypothetical protein EDEG_02983 [Edhazardia aedis USNM 41457]
MVILRTPKGTVDYTPEESALINYILSTTTEVFKTHGAVNIDTPTFEHSSILKNKFGDDQKLVFDLADQGGEEYSLRYDLTVSFARYLAQNKISKIKRYQIGKVFRRDQPVITKGRFREFLQCDFDIAGSYENMLADAEILKIVSECMQNLFQNKKFTISVNHRLIHTAYLESLNVDPTLHSTICSTIDKCHKISEIEMRTEFESKGLQTCQINQILEYTKLSGKDQQFILYLKKLKIYNRDAGKKAIDDLELLQKYCNIFKCTDNIVFDLSLARGLDYYTGIIFEVKINDSDVGSIIGGGRYDNLVRDFVKSQELKVQQVPDINLSKTQLKKMKKRLAQVKNEDNENFEVPCVGFSLGIARICSILKDSFKVGVSDTKVFVGCFGDRLLEERLVLVSMLWDHNVPAETFYSNLHYKKQAAFALKAGIPIVVSIGADELIDNVVKVSYGNGLEEKATVKRSDLVYFLRNIITRL